jgi:hypothetical protein
MFYTNKEKICSAMFASKYIGEASNNNSLLQQSVLSERTVDYSDGKPRKMYTTTEAC